MYVLTDQGKDFIRYLLDNNVSDESITDIYNGDMIGFELAVFREAEANKNSINEGYFYLCATETKTKQEETYDVPDMYFTLGGNFK